MSILPLETLSSVVSEHRAAGGKKIVQCHGVFDLLHIGHIKHLEAARKHGDILLVTITPDRFVNKGPHRPAFPEGLRAEALDALACVDYVAINKWPTAVETIELLRPDFFVKGTSKESGKRDHTDAILIEEEAVKKIGGTFVLTDEPTFSASNLINRYMEVLSPEATAYLKEFRRLHSPETIISGLEKIKELKILTIGETIIDEYQFCHVMAKANKDPILAARILHSERYAGGILAIANHLANFCPRTGIATFLGEIERQEDFIRQKLHQALTLDYVTKKNSPTIVKRRFLEEYASTKLFEAYVMENGDLSKEEEDRFCTMLDQRIGDYDLVIVADYGHGLMSPKVIELVCNKAEFLAINVQTNAGNAGFNLISKYPRADFISIAEPEARLEVRSRNADIEQVALEITRKVSCPNLLITRGKYGCLFLAGEKGFIHSPALAVNMVDRIGSGDAVLALGAPCVQLGMPPELTAFVANVAGAEACAIMGNQTSIEPSSFFRHLTSLLK